MQFIWKNDKDIGLYILQLYTGENGHFKNMATLYDCHYYYVPFTRYTYSYDNELGYVHQKPLKSENLKDAKKELIDIFIKMYSDEIKILKERMSEYNHIMKGLKLGVMDENDNCTKGLS